MNLQGTNTVVLIKNQHITGDLQKSKEDIALKAVNFHSLVDSTYFYMQKKNYSSKATSPLFFKDFH